MRRGVWLLLALLPVSAASFCHGGPKYYADKYAPAAAVGGPSPLPVRPLAPERQTEPHTCGLHALASVYAAHGLDAQERELRFRLGIDRPANRLLPETTGALPPDLLRVARQDGFEAELLVGSDERAAQELRAHLASGQLALALIDIGALHWVAMASGEREDDVVVCDSLRAGLREAPLERWLSEPGALALVLLAPRAAR